MYEREQPRPDELIPTRQSLLSRLKDLDDNASWKAFFDTYWRLIYSAAVRAGLTETEAEDVVQETVIAVTKSISKFAYNPGRGSFKAWLLLLTNWRIHRQFEKRLPVQDPRAREADSTETDDFHAIPDPRPSPFDALWEEDWEKNLVDAAMQRIKAKVDGKQFQIFDLCVRKKWPVTKVATDLQVRRGTVYLVKHRIGRLLKKEITRLRATPF